MGPRHHDGWIVVDSVPEEPGACPGGGKGTASATGAQLSLATQPGAGSSTRCYVHNTKFLLGLQYM